MRIYAGNLSYDTSEQDLRQAFEAHGEVQEVSMIQDRDTGRPKGFAFVEMPTSGEAQAAITALNGTDLAGRSITVNEAKPRVERSSGGGGGGFGGGGGGGGFGGGRSGGGGGGRSPRW
ncbi:MAG: RNA-binding protein [bacterium]|nr:RNA-binding protein [Chloroflexota bacterium]MCZ6873753.1 RNA-binding protein [bacterium]